MAVSYTATAWNSGGTYSSYSSYKDVTVTVASGDLIAASGHSEGYWDTGTAPAVTTVSGSVGSWTTSTWNQAPNDTCSGITGWATASGSGSVTVRVRVRTVNANARMGAAVWVVPAAEWTDTPAISLLSANDADGRLSLVVSATSTVVYAGGDWSALNPGTGTTPSGGTVGTTYYDTTNYAAFTAHWTAQASGTRDYGPNGLSGRDWNGAVLAITEPSTSSTDLVVADATHAHGVDAATLTQTHSLTVADATHAHTADAPALTQAHQLDAAATVHAHTVDDVTVTADLTLTVAATLHAHTVDAPALTQAHQLDAAATEHAHTVDGTTVTQAHTLTVAETVHGHTVDQVTVVEVAPGDLTVADATHGHTVDAPALTQAHTLTVADTVHDHTVDGVVLSSEAVLTVADTVHAHTADAVVLVQGLTLAVDDTVHATGSDTPALTQAHVLVAQDALHGHTADAASFISFSAWVAGVEEPSVSVTVWTGTAETAAVAMDVHVATLRVRDATHTQTVEAPAVRAAA